MQYPYCIRFCGIDIGRKKGYNTNVRCYRKTVAPKLD